MSETLTQGLKPARELLIGAAELALCDGRTEEAALYLAEANALGRYLERLELLESGLLWVAADGVERLADRSARLGWAELDVLDSATAEIQAAAVAAEEEGL